MKESNLKSREKRLVELEERVEPRTLNGIIWKDWRLAVAGANRTELAREVDEAARKIREAVRRKVRK